jgi:hypothetical protein
MSATQRLSKSKPKSQMPVQRSTSESSSSDAGTANAGVSGFYSAGPVLNLGGVQGKLVVGQANDPYEREADMVADQVVQGKPVTSISSISQGGDALTQSQPDQEEEGSEDETLSQPLLLQREENNEKEPEENSDELAQPFIQRQSQDEEKTSDELAQPLLIQRQGEDEEQQELEEPIQPLLLQRQAVNPVGETKKDTAPIGEDTDLIQSCGCIGSCSCGAKTNDSKQLPETEHREEITKPNRAVIQSSTDTTTNSSSNDPNAVSRAIHQRGSGEPLNPKVQLAIESQTGFDMGDVRVHSDSSAQSATRALKAKAFTHGSNIWLGSGESPDNLRLMAHEATHVVQQTSSDGAIQTIQRKPSDYQHTEDGSAVQSRLNRRFDRETRSGEQATTSSAEGANRGSAGAIADARHSSSTIDRRELRQRTSEVKGDTRPDVNRPAQEQPRITQSAAAVEQTAESPPDPLVKGEQASEPKAKEKTAEDAMGAAEQASGLARQAFATAQAQPEPTPEIEVQPPESVMPMDAGGEVLQPDPDAEVAIGNLADRAQFLREQGTLMRAQAVEGRGNAQIIRGNLARVGGEISKAEQGITKSQEHTQYRREVVGQAEQALSVSEEKAATVAAQAPEYQSKSDEGREETSPMSSEASSLVSENAANTPEDPEAAANSREQGQKINQVSSDATAMDSAVSQTRARSDSLAQDAAHASEMNSQTRGKITTSQGQLDQLDAHLSQHSEQANQARGQVESMAGQPDDLSTRSDSLEEQGQGLIASSFELEERLHRVQQSYSEGMHSIPPTKPWEGETSEEEDAVQMQPSEESASSIPAGTTEGDRTEGGASLPDQTTIASAPSSAPVTASTPETASVAPQQSVPESTRATGLESGAIEEQHTEGDEQRSETEAPTANESTESNNAGGSENPAEEAESSGSTEVQPEPVELPPREREQINLNCQMPPWVTGTDPESCQQHEGAVQEQDDQRRREIAEINQLAQGRPISQLGAGQRLGIALRMVGRGYYNNIANIKWPGWGNLAKALLDPRSMLTGTIGGLNMILNAGANLFSAQRWRQDPLGNALKSAADIATGLAIVLGSITVLAGVVAAIMGALLLISFGSAAPIALPVISVCTTIITTVGGWTIAVGKVALILQALSLIKNLIDAATAQTAEDLQRETGEIQSDINGGFAAAMAIVGAKGAQAGIQQVRNRAAGIIRASRRAGGARALAQATIRTAPSRLRAAGARALRGARRRVVTAPRRLARKGRAVVESVRSLPGRVRDRLRGLREHLKSGRPNRSSLRQHRDTLRQTARKRGGELTSHELDAELDVVRNTRPRQILRGDYVEEVRLPNGHKWRRNRYGKWCRFSSKPDICTTLLGEGPETSVLSRRRIPQDNLESRVRSGRARGGKNLPAITGEWLHGSRGRLGSLFPGQIAQKMRGIRFRNWKHFRETFWRFVADDPELSKGFKRSNLIRMRRGRAPYVVSGEATGGRANAVYQLNHIDPLEHGGGLYDLNNIEIVTPRVHEVLARPF